MSRSHEAEARFRELYADHYGAVLAYAVRRTPPGGDAQDVVADTFLAAWRRLRDVPAEPDARWWLLATARRVLANAERARRRRTRLAARLHAVPDAPADAGIEAMDDGARVRAALAALPEPDRELLRLVLWDDLDHAAAAAVLGCTPNAVAIRLHRARARLRELLDVPADVSVPAYRPAVAGSEGALP